MPAQELFTPGGERVVRIQILNSVGNAIDLTGNHAIDHALTAQNGSLLYRVQFVDYKGDVIESLTSGSFDLSSVVTSITNEVIARVEGDTANADDLATEIAARIAGDLTLNEYITTINTTLGSLSTTVGGHTTSINSINSSITTINGQIATINAFLASLPTFPLSIANGGTGASTAANARNNLDVQQHNAKLDDIVGITYASGDIFYYDGTHIVKLAKGSNGNVLVLASGLPSWGAAASSGIQIIEQETPPDHTIYPLWYDNTNDPDSGARLKVWSPSAVAYVDATPPGQQGPIGLTGAASTVPGPAAWSAPAAWITATAYSAGPPAGVVTTGGETYVCLVGHTSGTFATDLAAGKWLKVAAKGVDGATGALILISEVVTSATQASVSFTGIAATYRDLEVRVRGRGAIAGTDANVALQFNGDTTANYAAHLLWINSTPQMFAFGASGGATSAMIGTLPGNTAVANMASLIEAHIQDYRGTTFAKSGISQSGIIRAFSGGNLFTETGIWAWNSTAAINRVDVLCPSGFVNNSVVSLYGRN